MTSTVQQFETASAPASAMKHEPMDIAAVDAHADGDRIWATIVALRDHFMEVEPDENEALAAMKKKVEDVTTRVRAAFDAFTENGFNKADLAELTAALDDLEAIEENDT